MTGRDNLKGLVYRICDPGTRVRLLGVVVGDDINHLLREDQLPRRDQTIEAGPASVTVVHIEQSPQVHVAVEFHLP